MPFLVRWLVNAAALWVATQIVSGVSYSGGALPLLAVALVFGVVNAVIRRC
jgi:putative membrane protein